MSKKRPIKRITRQYVPGEGKAQVLENPGDLSHLLFVASRSEQAVRNVAILWMLFASGCRISETAQLLVSDLYYPTGELKQSFVIPGGYTKTDKPRLIYIKVRQQREALQMWKEQRLAENAMLSDDGSYGGLLGTSPLFLSKKSGWRTFAFNTKKYKSVDGIRETLVCASLENTIRDIIKSAGFMGGSSHSGRRSLATLLDRKGCNLDVIQKVLGHVDDEMTLNYIEPWMERIDHAYKQAWKGVQLPDFKDNISLNAER